MAKRRRRSHSSSSSPPTTPPYPSPCYSEVEDENLPRRRQRRRSATRGGQGAPTRSLARANPTPSRQQQGSDGGRARPPYVTAVQERGRRRGLGSRAGPPLSPLDHSRRILTPTPPLTEHGHRELNPRPAQRAPPWPPHQSRAPLADRRAWERDQDQKRVGVGSRPSPPTQLQRPLEQRATTPLERPPSPPPYLPPPR